MKRSTQKGEKPFLKTQSIKILRGTIHLLEEIVERLESEPVSLSPNSTSPETLPESTTALDTTPVTSELEGSTPVTDTPILTPGGTAAPTGDKTEVTPPRTQKKLVDWLYPSFQTVQRVWDRLLVTIRSLLPETWNQKLSDWGLTSAIASILVILLLTTVALLPKTPSEIAKEVLPEEPVAAPPELTAPEPPEPLESTESPSFVEVPEPAPVELTPEQSLIASIQDQVAEITDQYANGLIQSIQANFKGSRLIVTVSDSWYELDELQQNQLADELFHRSQNLDFSKLEITSSDGTLLARSPVVGPYMVILQRKV